MPPREPPSASGPGAASPVEADTGAINVRTHRPGDLGWVISRHGELYAQEFGWTIAFEALVARIAADFIDHFDPAQEACWIAERSVREGPPERLGCVMLVKARDEQTGMVDPGVAQLRLLLVEPAARGLGLGARLVAQCTRFARERGQRRLRLWTQSCLLPARQIYQREGYRLCGSEPHHSFGHSLIGEIWEMPLE